MHDYLTTGSTFGELALLTETPVWVDAVCETTVLMYHIQYESIRTALDWMTTTDPPLDRRLWLTASVRLALPLLKALPTYYNSSPEELKVLTDHGALVVRRLESQLQDATAEERFPLARHISNHVILIHGTATKSGRETFVGPIIIPPDNDDLIFSSLLCDLYVMYIVPHRTAVHSVVGVTPAATAPSDISPSDLSLQTPTKDVAGFLAAPRDARGAPPAGSARPPPSRRRGKSVSAPSNMSMKHLEQPVVQIAPLDVVGEESHTTLEKIESDKNEDSLKETGESSELTANKMSSAVSFTIIKPPSSMAVPDVPSARDRQSAEHIEPIGEELPAVRVMASADSVTVSPDTVKEQPEETKLASESASEGALTFSDGRSSAATDVLPRKSVSEILGERDWTEAWKRVSPQIKLTVGKEVKPVRLAPKTATTSVAATASAKRDSTAGRVSPAADQKKRAGKGGQPARDAESSRPAAGTSPETSVAPGQAVSSAADKPATKSDESKAKPNTVDVGTNTEPAE